MIKKFMLFVSLLTLQTVSYASTQNEEETKVLQKTNNLTLSSDLFLPDDILNQLIHVSDIDDAFLLSFRSTSKNIAKLVEKFFHEKSSIRLPLSCLTNPENPHPYPHTVSYFVRKLIWNSLMTSKESPITKKYIDFANEYNFVGKNVFPSIIQFQADLKAGRILPAHMIVGNFRSEDLTNFAKTLSTKTDDKNQDYKELFLIFHAASWLKSSSGSAQVDPVRDTFSLMTNSEKREIGSYYVTKVVDNLFRRASNRYGDSRVFFMYAGYIYKCMTELEDTNTNFVMGKILNRDGNMNYEDAYPYFKKAADQGHLGAQLEYGRFLLSNNEREEALKYYKLAAAQGHDYSEKLIDIYNNSFSLEEVKKLESQTKEEDRVIKYIPEDFDASRRFQRRT